MTTITASLVVAFGLVGCSLLPLPGASSPNSSSSSTPSMQTASADTPEPAKAPPSPFKDADEGAWALQAAHEGQIVFSHAALAKTDSDESKLVTTTRLDKPLFVRAFVPKTPLRLEHDRDPKSWCTRTDSRLTYRFTATLVGADPKKMDSQGNFGTYQFKKDPERTLRSISVDGADGDHMSPATIIPQQPFDVTTGIESSDNRGAYRFITLASMMKPGKNVISLVLNVGCEGHSFGEVARGEITIDIKGNELAAFSRKVIKFPPSRDPSVKAQLQSRYAKSLNPGHTVVAFNADAMNVEKFVKRWANVRAIVRHPSGKCGWIYGSYEEGIPPNQFSGRFLVNGEFAMPCP